MLNIFVGEAFAVRTLCQSYAFSKRAIISFAVGCVEVREGLGAGDAERHGGGRSVILDLHKLTSSKSMPNGLEHSCSWEGRKKVKAQHCCG